MGLNANSIKAIRIDSTFVVPTKGCGSFSILTGGSHLPVLTVAHKSNIVGLAPIERHSIKVLHGPNATACSKDTNSAKTIILSDRETEILVATNSFAHYSIYKAIG